MRLLRSRPLAALVGAGAVLVIVGAAWFVGSDFGAVSVGWFTYSATEVNFSEGTVAMSRSGAAALAVLLLGVLLLSAAGGYRLGRRRTASTQSGADPEGH